MTQPVIDGLQQIVTSLNEPLDLQSHRMCLH